MSDDAKTMEPVAEEVPEIPAQPTKNTRSAEQWGRHKFGVLRVETIPRALRTKGTPSTRRPHADAYLHHAATAKMKWNGDESITLEEYEKAIADVAEMKIGGSPVKR